MAREQISPQCPEETYICIENKTQQNPFYYPEISPKHGEVYCAELTGGKTVANTVQCRGRPEALPPTSPQAQAQVQGLATAVGQWAGAPAREHVAEMPGELAWALFFPTCFWLCV